MKNSILLALLVLISSISMAQYNTFSIQKSDVPNLKILQIDNRKLSTLIHFRYTEKESGFRWISLNEDIYIKDLSNNKKYKLLNSINLPFSPQKHVFDNIGQIHNFTLEFEKIPDGVQVFDIIESTVDGFNFYGVKIDWNNKTNYFVDVAPFVEKTPVKEFSFYYKDDKPVFFYKYKGITIAVMMTYSDSYGKYYQANILIQNLSGKDLNFNPNYISAHIVEDDDLIEIDALSYNEYMKKVQNRQAWSAFAIAFSEGMAASNAGYSTTSSSYKSSGYSNSTGAASGYLGNTYGSVYLTSSSYNSTYGTSYSRSYDGAAAYQAQQNANNNVANYQYQQRVIKDRLSDGYVRLNTIPSGTEYIGYINLKYKKADKLQVVVPFFDTNFLFIW